MTLTNLTTSERAALFGISYRDQRALETEQPWLAHWSSRFEAGAEHVRAWLAAGRPAADLNLLCIVGDRAIIEAAREVFAKLPACVAHYIINNAVIVCGGVETSGWVGDLPKLPPGARLKLVSLSTADPATLAHELAHAFQIAPSPFTEGLTARQREALVKAVREILVEKGESDQAMDETMQRECAADALARAWGFPIDTTTGRRAESRRRGMQRELERDAQEEKGPK